MKMRSETLTLVLVNLAGIMERADETLLPGVYKEIGSALDTDPTGLGSLTLFRSIVQTACYPLAAYLAIRHNRAHVIALGAFLWAGATFLVGFSTTFFQVAVSRALNGIGLAIVVPAIQSLVADSTDESNRGLAFGWLQLTGNFGSIFGNLCGVLLASTSFLRIPGWRIAFHLIGIISVVVGLLVRVFANDPRFVDENTIKCPKPSRPSFCSELKDVLQEAKSVIKIPTFQIFVAQGVSGSFPWSALSFAPMWLELTGFSHETTAFLMTGFIIGGSLGGLFGGKLGDVLSTRLPNAGRIILSQISAGSGIPLAALLLLGLPDDPSKAFLYGSVLFAMGFFISWNGPATNMPMFAEIVPEKQRTSVYALDRCFESILASFAPPIVGILAQRVYGYRHAVSTATEIETDKKNATSLAKALYTSIGIPFAICVSIYSFLYCTYPRDKERARMQAFIESEIQLIGEEEDAAACRRDSSTSADQELRFSGEEMLYEEGKGLKDDDCSVVDVRHYNGAGDETAEFDDSDEKSLLPVR